MKFIITVIVNVTMNMAMIMLWFTFTLCSINDEQYSECCIHSVYCVHGAPVTRLLTTLPWICYYLPVHTIIKYFLTLTFDYLCKLYWRNPRSLRLHIVYSTMHWILKVNIGHTVLESPGIPVTGSPSILKGYHNSLIDGSPSILVSLMV